MFLTDLDEAMVGPVLNATHLFQQGKKGLLNLTPKPRLRYIPTSHWISRILRISIFFLDGNYQKNASKQFLKTSSFLYRPKACEQEKTTRTRCKIPHIPTYTLLLFGEG